MGSNKLSKEYVDNLLSRSSLIPIDENYTYINNSTQIPCYDYEGYVVMAKVSKIKPNSPNKFRRYSISNPFTISNIKMFLSLYKPDIELMTTTYEDNIRLLLKCKVDGYEWDSSLTNLIKQNSNFCPKCQNVSKLNFEEVVSEVYKHNKEVKVVSNEYFGVDVNLDLLCLNDGSHGIFPCNLSNIRKGRGCPKCAIETKRLSGGIYNLSSATRMKDKWSEIPSMVYVVKMENEEESFIKVGITKVNVNKRFKTSPYKITTIILMETDLYTACQIERSVMVDFLKHRYSPSISFKGYTECFTLSSLPLIQNFLTIGGHTC